MRRPHLKTPHNRFSQIFQRAFLPFFYNRQNFVCDPADYAVRNINIVSTIDGKYHNYYGEFSEAFSTSLSVSETRFSLIAKSHNLDINSV